VLAELFREHGYDGASLSLISKATGLGKGSLYNFFPGGKEEMLAAVLAQIDAWFEAHVFEPLTQAEAAEAALAAMFDAVDGYFRSGRRVCLVGVLALGDASRDQFAGPVRSYFRRWVDALANALRRAGHDKGVAMALAEDVVAGIQGGIILARALEDPGAFGRTMAKLKARVAQPAKLPLVGR
jgi:TetR/AcrR family transcriptional repressor of lmrAB and yxaGH operons